MPQGTTKVGKTPTQTAMAIRPSAPIQKFDQLPDTALLRERDLIRLPGCPHSILPFSSTTLWRKVNDGEFPKPQKLSARMTVWSAGAVRAWLAQQAVAA